ncbi:YafY family protein [Sutterella sp.]|uniref:helix-turn-helix transcriptional regulator n=1 Tax=Sutterella sp. TaxID=1981025 RepID=UPI0026E0FCD7|nr:WYL domain-containing protein [Sutterella sp.]MDO5532281.1 WYL domain-containing protein [Sutterella sp.]
MTKAIPNSCMFEDVITMIRILELIPQHRWVTIAQIHEQLEAQGVKIHRRTLQRYLKTIRENPDVFPIKTNAVSKPYGFQWSAGGHGVHLPALGPQETLLLRLADEHLHYQMPAPVLTGLNSLFRDARRSTNINRSGYTSTWLRKIKVISPSMQFMPPQIRGAVFDAVTVALAGDRYLTVRYRDALDRQIEKIVEPLGLVQQDVRAWLVCADLEEEDEETAKATKTPVEHIPLHRIEVARVLEETFSRPKDFDLEDYTANADFNNAAGRPVKLEIVTDDMDLVKRLSDTPFNHSQKIDRADSVDGRPAWTVSAVVENSPLLDGWLTMNRASILDTTKTPARKCFAENQEPEEQTKPQILVKNRRVVEE